MYKLYVFAFSQEAGASDFVDLLAGYKAEKDIGIEDVAWVVRAEDGSPSMARAHNLVGPGGLSGLFWGVLLGLILWSKWWGLSVGGAIGSLGLDDQFVDEVGDAIGKGHSALFLLTQADFLSRIPADFANLNPQVISADLEAADMATLGSIFR